MRARGYNYKDKHPKVLEGYTFKLLAKIRIEETRAPWPSMLILLLITVVRMNIKTNWS